MTSAELSAIRADLSAAMERLRAIEARLGGEIEALKMHVDDHADRTWPPPRVIPSDPYWQWQNLENAAAHGPFKATKLYELRDRISLKVEGRRYYSLTQIWREHRPR
ncbi:hypothetical protein EET67_20610 [Pseudaminobacter arsenicus]|uniref:Uncharacterized protein n=1 Tax=Borborobacter arsenicus TaxID=1851146 RepID=A0A432V1E6_9HYPH|nr:hypothetical protein [Pseudaminobacter arsenicus]RUM95925.1 hypothetical protein EET67_20610 [Pseudaminobacter arsenicus]